MTQVIWALVVCWGLTVNPTCESVAIYDTDRECVVSGINLVSGLSNNDLDNLHSVYCERRLVTDA